MTTWRSLLRSARRGVERGGIRLHHRALYEAHRAVSEGGEIHFGHIIVGNTRLAPDRGEKEDVALVVHSQKLTTEAVETSSALAAEALDDSAQEHGRDTLPSAPALEVDDDDELALLVAHVEDAKAFLKSRAWDNLAHVERFAAGAAIAVRILARFDDDATRRRLVALLWPLLPQAVKSVAHAPFDLPSSVDVRAPMFAIRSGDVPRISSSYSAFLSPTVPPVGTRARDLFDDLFRVGAGPFLVPRALCPGAARGACTAVTLVEKLPSTGTPSITSLPPVARDGRLDGRAPATWRCVIARGAMGLDGDDLTVRIGADGQPLRGVDGREEPITVSEDVLAAWLFSAGPDARGLDLRSEDDRALLLLWSHALHTVFPEGEGTSAFAWLERDDAPASVRVRVVEHAIVCAIQAVARFSLDPLACRITLRSSEGDGGWTERAAAALDACAQQGVQLHDVVSRATPREPSSLPAHASPVSAERSAAGARDVVWLDAFLRPGLVGGRLTPLAAGRAFARLATSVLAPLGVLPLSGCKDGSGAVLLQRLVEPMLPDGELVERAPPRLVSFDAVSHGRAHDELLVHAWSAGRGPRAPRTQGRPAPRRRCHGSLARILFGRPRMITVGSLEVRNRARAEAPVVVVVTRRRLAASDDAVRFVTSACRALDVDTVGLDVDEPDNGALLDELGVRFIPEVLAFARGVLLERTTVTSTDDAHAVLSLALRRHRRPPRAQRRWTHVSTRAPLVLAACALAATAIGVTSCIPRPKPLSPIENPRTFTLPVREQCASGDYTEPTSVGFVADNDLAEASGIVASPSHPGVLWSHNDSGDEARLFAMSTTGAALGVLEFPGVEFGRLRGHRRRPLPRPALGLPLHLRLRRQRARARRASWSTRSSSPTSPPIVRSPTTRRPRTSGAFASRPPMGTAGGP